MYSVQYKYTKSTERCKRKRVSTQYGIMSRRGGRGGGSSSAKSNVTKELLKRSAYEAGLDDRHIKVLSDITKPPLFPDFLWKSTGHYWNIDNDDDNGTKNNNYTIDGQQQQPVKVESSSLNQQSSSSSTKRALPSSMISMINKQRDITKRYQNSIQYIRSKSIVDIVRYSDRSTTSSKNSNKTSDAMVLESICPASSVLSSTSFHDRMSNNHKTLATDSRYFPDELLLNKKDTKKSVLKFRPTHKKQKLNNYEKVNFPSLNEQPSKSNTIVSINKLQELEDQQTAISIQNKLRATSITSLFSTTSTATDDIPDITTSTTITKHKKKRVINDDDEDQNNNDDNNNDNDDDDDDDDDNVEGVIEEEELGEDYTTNYYATDEEDDVDLDDGEPTF